MMKLILLIEIITSILLLVFWCTQFLKLMRMKPEDFPSTADKTIWAAALIILTILGAFVFWLEFRPKSEECTLVDDGKYREIRDIDHEVYEEAKSKFPDHIEEIDLALNLSLHERISLENHYRKKTPSVLLMNYAEGAKDIKKGCFGIQLAVLTARNMESIIPNQRVDTTRDNAC